MTALPWLSPRALACRILLAGRSLAITSPQGVVTLCLAPDGASTVATAEHGGAIVVELDAFDVIAAVFNGLYFGAGGARFGYVDYSQGGRVERDPLGQLTAENALWRACAVAAPEWMPQRLPGLTEDERHTAVTLARIDLEQAQRTLRKVIVQRGDERAARGTLASASTAVDEANEALVAVLRYQNQIADIDATCANEETIDEPVATVRLPSDRPVSH